MMAILLMTVFFIGTALHLFLQRHRLTKQIVVEVVLLYALVIYVGGSGLFAFAGHAFKGEQVAQLIGWPTGNPFQLEVAVANLAFGVLGILCIWFRGDFWLATVIGYAVFLVGAMAVHVRESLLQGNAQAYNIGLPILFADVIVPAVLLGLVLAYRVTGKK